MEIEHALLWLQSTAIARTIAENEVLFPWIESLHVLAVVLVVGTISIIDMRLLGIASVGRSVSQILHEVLPLTWGAFALAALTGALMFSSNATTYAHNFFFRGKLVLLCLAGLNMAAFHLLGSRDIAQWGRSRQTPPAAKLAGALSLGIWISVVVFGRWTGFTLR
jgi:Family of unknown function (DUF6644)